MVRLIRPRLAALVAVAVAAPLLAATPAESVRARISAYRELGAAFKGTNDSLRDEVQTVMLQQYARQIRNASRAQYALFPAGTGAQAGVRTSAKAEIWTRPAEFKAAQDAFAREADAFQRVVSGGDATVIRAQARKLGGTCKGCHDTFKAPAQD